MCIFTREKSLRQIKKRRKGYKLLCVVPAHDNLWSGHIPEKLVSPVMGVVTYPLGETVEANYKPDLENETGIYIFCSQKGISEYFSYSGFMNIEIFRVEYWGQCVYGETNTTHFKGVRAQFVRVLERWHPRRAKK